MEAYHYNERGENAVFNQFDGKVAVGLVPDRFFLNFAANRNQAIVDPLSTLATSTLAFTTNRVDLDSYSVGPSFQTSAGGDSVVRGEFERTRVKYGDTVVPVALDNYDYDTTSVSADNYKRGSGLTWAAHFNGQKADYTNEFYEHREAGLELGFWSGQATRIFAVAGRESPWDTPLERGLKDPFWEVGFVRDVTSHLHAELGFGDRSFGASRHGKLDVTFAHGTSSLSYSQLPRTNSFDRFNRGALVDPADPDYLFRADAIERYIANRWQWNLLLKFTRMDVTLIAYNELRDHRTRVDGTPLSNETQNGARLTVTWKMGPRMDLIFSGGTADNHFDEGAGTDLGLGSIGLLRRLGSRTAVRVQYDDARVEYTPVSTFGYRNHMLTASVARQF
jgi:hypothetical protein